ncbi:MAG: nucleotidyltransferase domain-containing protein [Candidatus Heimdallarchaeaceae archaeon]
MSTPPSGPPRGPQFTRDEYQNLIDEFSKDIKENLKAEVKSLLLVGSVSKKEHIAGESDCDFLIVINEKASAGDKLHKTLEKIGKIITKYLEDPLFASLIDVEILEESDIPKGKESSLYPWTKIIMAQNGKALIGDNPFAKIEVKDEDLKQSAKAMARTFFNQMKDLIIFQQDDEYQQLFIAVEAVLGCACAYLYYHGEKEFFRSTAHMLFEEKYKEKINIEPVLTSNRLRLAAKSVDTTHFIPSALAFCRSVIEELYS